MVSYGALSEGIVTGDVSLVDIICGCIPSVACELIMLGILVVVPQLALWLPSEMIQHSVL